MSKTLNTKQYDNVVLIDSQVVLEAKPLAQLPWAELFQGSILLLVARQVQTEIDKRKNDGRLGQRARAFNKLLDGFIVNRLPSQVSQNPRVDVATVANMPIDWDALGDLDRDDGDDRIVAQALNALIDDPSRIVLLSHDMRPRDAAATHGLRAAKLPDTWLRDPEPSPDQRRINELEAKLRLLSADQPQVSVTLQCVSAEPWTYREVLPANSDQLAAILDRELATAPYPSRRGPFDIGLGSFDHTHEERLADWEALVREEIPQIHRGLTKLHAQHRLKVTIENVGSVPAEGLSLEIRSGNAVLYAVPYWVLVVGPPAPQPQPYFLPHISPRDLLPRREPFTFYWDQRGPGSHLTLSCSSFRQEKKAEFEVSIELLRSTPPKAQIEAIVTASNMKGDARGRLLMDVQTLSVPFDEAFDVDQGMLRFNPLVDPPDDPESDDFLFLQNSGAQYEPD